MKNLLGVKLLATIIYNNIIIESKNRSVNENVCLNIIAYSVKSFGIYFVISHMIYIFGITRFNLFLYFKTSAINSLRLINLLGISFLAQFSYNPTS